MPQKEAREIKLTSTLFKFNHQWLNKNMKKAFHFQCQLLHIFLIPFQFQSTNKTTTKNTTYFIMHVTIINLLNN